MNSGHGERHNRHCHHCGRPVRDTTHTRADYSVDYYGLHTGDVEPVQLQNRDDGESTTILRLVRPYEVFTCVECYRKASVQDERERLFRPELAEASTAKSN
ncbi:MAG TPA: hypothetical protein VMT89_10945 [Candidatus Acidoferrales bacterium]|nr:hypothetical protein [Candidatus Acidoferrales bacterium]